MSEICHRMQEGPAQLLTGLSFGTTTAETVCRSNQCFDQHACKPLAGKIWPTFAVCAQRTQTGRTRNQQYRDANTGNDVSLQYSCLFAHKMLERQLTLSLTIIRCLAVPYTGRTLSLYILHELTTSKGTARHRADSYSNKHMCCSFIGTCCEAANASQNGATH